MDVVVKDITIGPFFKLGGHSGFTLLVRGGLLDIGNVSTSVDNKEIVLTPSATNYVFVDWSSQEIVANVTGFTNNCKLLYEIVTDASGITSITDKRAVPRVSAHSCYASHNAVLVDETTNINEDWDFVDLTTVSGLVIPKNACMVKMNIAAQDSGVIGAGVYISVRKPGETLLTQEFRIYPQESGIWLAMPAVEVGLDSSNRFERKIQISGTFKWKATLCGWGFGR